MSPAFDPVNRLALALEASRGAYAVLLGSGISAAAGVPTGRQIVADLIGKLAALEGASAGEDAFAWYRDRFGREPDYSILLDELAASPTERSELLKGYFEGRSLSGHSGLIAPAKAHHALAQLAARGYVSVFLTTNFDRLLERALESAGVAPTVLGTPDSLEGAPPLGRARCTLVKLNGDYLDTRIKNTPDELARYDPAIERLLDRILDEFGLIVCGWSADWDTALRRAFERRSNHRYTTFWASRSAPRGLAAELVERTRAELIRIGDADSFFTDLVAKLSALERAEGAAPSASAGRAALPVRAASFVGRRTELADIERLLGERTARLVTLVGPGGTGKTSLAIQAAENAAPGFADGVVFVDLSSTRTTDGALVAISRALGLEEDRQRPIGDVIRDHLRPRRMLLVLDNFEQVIEAADFVARLLAECPTLGILATSRRALNIRGERLYPVLPLRIPPAETSAHSAGQLQAYEAVQLFLERARAVRPDFNLDDDNASVIAEICRRLDGLPLAIELAAARLRLLSPKALREQLRERLALLSGGARDLPERQRTLRATMDWSYALLDPGEQRLFELMSVFAGTDLGAVEAVAAQVRAAGIAVPDALDGLIGLLDKSLVTRMDLAGGATRVAMLETIREFATDRLNDRPDFAGVVRRAHASYYAGLAARLQAEIGGTRPAEALTAMAAEIDNLQIAWRFWLAAREMAQLEKLAEALLSLNEARGWYLATVEMASGLLAVLAAGESASGQFEQEAALRTVLARALLATRGYTPEVEEAFARGIELSEHGGDPRRHFSALRGLSYLYALRGDLQNARQSGLELLDFAERENEPTMLIEANLRVGASKTFVDDVRGGLAHLDRAISLFAGVPRRAFALRAGGNDPRVACYTTSAFALWFLGYPDQAVARAEAALSLAADLDHPFSLAYARFHTGLLHLWLADFETALARAREVTELAGQHGFKVWNATGGVLLGAAEVGLGRNEEGLANLDSGMTLYEGLRSPPVFWPILLSVQATALLRAGRPADGLGPAEAALSVMGAGAGTSLMAEVQMLEGDLLAARANQEGREEPQAEGWYRSAYERARATGVAISALRAASRLYRATAGRKGHGAARRALAQSCAGFTEGAVLPDLVEARALLAAAAPA